MLEIIREHKNFYRQIIGLSWLDMRREYRGAALSWAWAIIRPLVFLGVYFFTMKFGMRVSVSKEGIDLFPWLIVGLAVWFFIQDILNAGSNSFRRYSFLISKTKFPVSIIPTIVVLSQFFVHLGLMIIVMVYLFFFEDAFAWTWIQIPMYMTLLASFSVFWSLFASPLTAISKDFYQLIKSVTRILFWLSGVLWNVRNIENEWVRSLFMLNPVTGFIEGYRDALLYHEWFWQSPVRFTYLISALIILAFLAVFVFKKTRKEVVDVL